MYGRQTARRGVPLGALAALGVMSLVGLGCPDSDPAEAVLVPDSGGLPDVQVQDSGGGQADLGPELPPVGDEGHPPIDEGPPPIDEGAPPECEADLDCVDSPIVVGACEKKACQVGLCVPEVLDDGATCDDGDACTESDACAGGVCGGALVECDDGDECTSDVCDPEVGCTSAALTDTPCDDGDSCTEPDSCVAGACVAGPNVCECVEDAHCDDLEDGDLCNGTLVCAGNECVIDPDTIKVCDPSAGTTCLDNTCVSATGFCELLPAPNGKNCDDGNVCTDLDGCAAGVCTGSPATCDDDDPCTVDSCNPAFGCHNDAGNDGASCDDGSDCTSGDACNAGACAGDGVDCNDGNPCTTDGCDVDGGCLFTPNTDPCDDGDPCTVADECFATLCVPGAVLDCDDTNPCTDDACTPGVGCEPTANTAPCDDADPCTLNDTCAASICTGGDPLLCDDGNPCTDDTCVEGQGCESAPNASTCDDGNPCTTSDLCEGGACAGGDSTCGCETNADCAEFEDGNLCNGTLICDKNKFPFSCKVDTDTVVTCDTSGDTACLENTCTPALGLCSPTGKSDGLACDDGSACTSADACQNGVCFGGAAPDCDDGEPCSVDSCDPSSGCAHEPASGPSCDDGNACTTVDACVDGVCKGSAPPDCDDANVCTVDLCDALSGCINANVGLPCSDGNPCTVTDSCFQGKCLGKVAPDCGDGNDCTLDSCDQGQGGCIHVPQPGDCQDGDACDEGDTCEDGVCGGGTPIDCDDTNVCTTDLCDPASGCVHQPNTGPCDDGNACTEGDICSDGDCSFASATVCDDANPCTDPACDAEQGCVFEPNSKPCDDGDDCTTDDVCADAECVAGPPKNCNDGNVCTDDGCDSTGGCTTAPNTAPCSDGNPCTNLGTCAAEECQPGLPIPCNDGNPCTADDCSPAAGGCSNPAQDGPCNDGDACTLNDFCSEAACQPGPDPQTCDDKSPCTDDACDPTAGCSHTANTATCDDGNPCTPTDLCSNLACVGTGLTSCDDGNPCTDDTCIPPDGCQHIDNELPCDDGDACTTAGKCQAGACEPGQGVPSCCVDDSDCNDGSACTVDSCTAGSCTNTPTGTVHYEEGFETGVATNFELLTDNLDDEDNPLVGWQVDSTNATTGTYSLYWGNPDTYSYDYEETYSEAIIDDFFVPYGPAVLSFKLFMDVQDTSDDCDFDVLIIEVDDNYVHEECESTFGWKQVHVDLSAFAGRHVKLNFVFDTGDEVDNEGQGVWIDDLVLVRGACQGATCASHADCEDHALCSGGACVDGKCDFTPAPPNQSWGESFDDMPAASGNGAAHGWALTTNNQDLKWSVSTARSASGPQSLYAGNATAQTYDFGAGVLTAKAPKFRVANNFESTLVFQLYMDVADASCASDVLTVKAGNTVLYEACGSTGGAFVDIGIPITQLALQDVQISFEFAASASGGAHEGIYIDGVAVVHDMECGTPLEDFNDKIPFNFMLESNNAGVYWHVSSKATYSPPFSLHCANPANHKYNTTTPLDCRATTAVQVCPTGQLQFRLRNGVQEAGCGADVFTVEVGPDVLLTECGGTAGKFLQKTVDLTPYADMTVPVTFRFQANATANNAEGPYVDEVILTCP